MTAWAWVRSALDLAWCLTILSPNIAHLVLWTAILLGVPTLLAAGAYKVFTSINDKEVSTIEEWLGFRYIVPMENWGQLALAMGVSAMTAFVSVRWLLRYIETHTFVAFGWYRIALGLALLFAINS